MAFLDQKRSVQNQRIEGIDWDLMSDNQKHNKMDGLRPKNPPITSPLQASLQVLETCTENVENPSLQALWRLTSSSHIAPSCISETRY
jgi:hypothetical protein